MIEVENLTKDFKIDFWSRPCRVLDGVTFKINKGKVTGFLGTNGIGKTTTINLILKFNMPTSGGIKYENGLLNQDGTFTSKLGYLPERSYSYPLLSGREFLTYMAKMNNVDSKEIDERIEFWMQKLNLSAAINRKIKTYSKGMAQRIGFISAVLHQPELIILDEPLSGLDPIGRKEIKSIIKKLNGDGKTIFFTTHVVSDVEEVCDDVIVLDKGKIKIDCSVNELIYKNSSMKYIVRINLDKELGKLELSDFKTLLNQGCNDLSQSCSFLVGQAEKDEFIYRLALNKIKIMSVEPDHPSLEDALYGRG